MVTLIGAPRTLSEAVALAENPPLKFEFEKWFALTFNRDMILSDGKNHLDMWFYEPNSKNNVSNGKKVLVQVIKDLQPDLNTVSNFQAKVAKENAIAGVILSLYAVPYLAVQCLNTKDDNYPIVMVTCEDLLSYRG